MDNGRRSPAAAADNGGGANADEDGDSDDPDLDLNALFEAIAAECGDETAFVGTSDGDARRDDPDVGFTELREATNAVAAELHHRHSIGRRRRLGVFSNVDGGASARARASEDTPLSTPGVEAEDAAAEEEGECFRRQSEVSVEVEESVLVVSGRPSAGEAAAVLACCRLLVPFVPLDVTSVGMARCRAIVDELRPTAAVVVLDGPTHGHGFRDDVLIGDEDSEDEPNREEEGVAPAGDGDDDEEDECTSRHYSERSIGFDSDVDGHEVVIRLASLGVHRVVPIWARDGTLAQPIGVSHLPLPPIVPSSRGGTGGSNIDRCRLPLYVMYTSGSSDGRPRAVVGSHGGLLNRLAWQWRTFPFVQRMRKRLGPAGTLDLLRSDGLLLDDDSSTTPRGDLVVRRTPLAFVDSVVEIFGTLLAGVPLWCPPHGDMVDGGVAGIANAAERVGATRVTLLPSQLGQALSRFSCGSGISGAGSDSGTDGGWPWRCLNVAIVSGEPCDPSIPRMWNETLPRGSVLVNLYGQTETSGDVLCAVVATGGGDGGGLDNDATRTEPTTSTLARFPKCWGYRCDHLLPPSRRVGAAAGIAARGDGKFRSWMVPCGFPIDGHSLVLTSTSTSASAPAVKSATADDDSVVGEAKGKAEAEETIETCATLAKVDGEEAEKTLSASMTKASSAVLRIGRLWVTGPGLAIGYLRRGEENRRKFRSGGSIAAAAMTEATSPSSSSSGSAVVSPGAVYFDTSDLALRDADTGAFYIMGRCPDDEDEGGGREGVGLSSTTMGKVNGVMIHVAEMEQLFGAALREAVRRCGRRGLRGCSILPRSSSYSSSPSSVDDRMRSISAVGVILTHDGRTKTAVFIESSTLTPPEGDDGDSSSVTGDGGGTSRVLFDHTAKTVTPNHLKLARDLMCNPNETDLHCHPSLVPHFAFAMSSLPRNGAARKIDRNGLAKLALEYTSTMAGRGTIGEGNDKLAAQRVSKTPLDEVRQVYGRILKRSFNDDDPSSSSPFEPSYTFSQLGGDSMMSIEAAWELSKLMAQKRKRGTLSHSHSYSYSFAATEVLRLPASRIADILDSGGEASLSGGDGGSPPPDSQASKRQKDDHDNAGECLKKTALDLLGGAVAMDGGDGDHDATSPQRQSSDSGILRVEWKCPLLMCVDAKPLVRNGFVVVGSQGGDLFCVDAGDGSVRWRMQLRGKIEGGVEAIDFGEGDHDRRKDVRRRNRRTLLFANSYVPRESSTGSKGVGFVHALDCHSDLHSTRPKILWRRKVAGELKSKPVCLEFPGSCGDDEVQLDPSRKPCQLRILTGSHDGSLYYLDGCTGATIWQCSSVGGAIHATPAVSPRTISDCYTVIVVSSSWRGRVACLSARFDQMVEDWHVDCWAPIYAAPALVRCSPSVIPGKTAMIFGCVDGTVRCLHASNGNQIWSTQFSSGGSPIFSGCSPLTNDRGEEVSAVVLGSHDGHVRCLRLEDGGIKWSLNVSSCVLGSPMVISHLDLVIVATTAGMVFSVDQDHGRIVSRLHDTLDGEVFSTPASHLAGCCFFVGCRDNFLYKVLL